MGGQSHYHHCLACADDFCQSEPPTSKFDQRIDARDPYIPTYPTILHSIASEIQCITCTDQEEETEKLHCSLNDHVTHVLL